MQFFESTVLAPRPTMRSLTIIAVLLLTYPASAGDCKSLQSENCSPSTLPNIGDPGVNGSVRTMASMPNGDLIVAGLFTEAGGQPASNIARWDGMNWHPIGEGANGELRALAVLPNGDIVAGGWFTEAGGNSASNIARWDGIAWHALGLGTDGAVVDMVVLPDGDLVVAGIFNTAGGQPAYSVARWDGSDWHAMSTQLTYRVWDLALLDDGSGPALYAGGPWGRTLKWEDEGWTILGDTHSSSGHEIRSLIMSDVGNGPELVIAGSFEEIDGLPIYRGVARLGETGWIPLGLAGAGPHYTLTNLVHLGEVNAQTLYGSSHGLLANWDGSMWNNIDPGFDGNILTLLQHDDGNGEALYIGGNFTEAQGKPAHGIIRWQPCIDPPVILHVPGNYATIQAAVDAACDGHIVRVAPGTYHEWLVLNEDKSVTIESEAGPEMTIIDAGGIPSPVVQVLSGTATLRGFTLTGSHAEMGGGVLVGFNARGVVDQCVITGNGNEQTFAGGGIYLIWGQLVVKNTTISHNQAQIGGGVLLVRNTDARFENCIIEFNQSGQGGGVDSNVISRATFTGCIFRNNEASGAFGPGGGADVFSNSEGPSLNLYDNCDFIENSGARGGGLFADANSVVHLRHTRLHDNTATVTGGGLLIYQYSHFNAVKHKIVGNTFSGNTAPEGGGISFVLGEPLMGDTLFCENQPQHIFGSYEDLGGNILFHICDPEPGDFDGDGAVDVTDLLMLLAAWGPCPDNQACLADLSGDGVVDVEDLLLLLASW